MTTVTTTLVSGQNAHVGAVSSRGEYSVSVGSGIQGPTGNTGVSITAANAASGNLILTFSNSSTIDVGTVIGANGANGSNGTAGANGVSITAANVVSGNLVLTFSNSATLNVGTVVGANGANGTNGSNGTNANTGNVTFTNTTIGTAVVNNNIVIQTRNVNPSASPAVNSTSSWTFGYDGDLTLPSQLIFPEGTTLYDNGMSVHANAIYAIRAYGNNGGADLQWFGNSASMGTTLWNAVRLNSPQAANSGTIVLSAGQFVASKNWEFGANGSLTFPDSTLQTTAFTGSANNALFLGGVAANQYAYANQVSAGSTNVAAQFAWTNSHTFSNSVTFSGSAVVPSSNTLGTALGSATQRWVLIANTGTFSGAVSGITTLAAGNTTITGFANVSSTLQVTGAATLSANLTVSGNIAGNTAGFAIGYRDVPQNFTNTSLTLALTDAGKHILTQNSGSSTQTVTIPPNGTVAFQTGAAITIIVQSTGTVAVANGAGVTMYLTGNSTAKSTVTLNSYSMATLLKIDTDTWMVSGTGAT